MSKKRMSPEQIIMKLREIEILSSQGSSISMACRNAGISEQTYYRWRKEYGGLKLNQAKRFKDLEKENNRLKKLVADLSLDNAILREVSSGKF
jgi:Transposase.